MGRWGGVAEWGFVVLAILALGLVESCADLLVGVLAP